MNETAAYDPEVLTLRPPMGAPNSEVGPQAVSQVPQPVLEPIPGTDEIDWESPSGIGYLYFAESEDGAIVKIGFTTDVLTRMYAIDRESRRLFGVGTKTIGYLVGTMADETKLHHRFRQHAARDSSGRKRREWYNADPDLIGFIRSRPLMDLDHIKRLFLNERLLPIRKITPDDFYPGGYTALMADAIEKLKSVRGLLDRVHDGLKSEEDKRAERQPCRRNRILVGLGKWAKPYGVLPGEEEILAVIRSMRKSGATLGETAEALNSAGYRTRYGRLWRIPYVVRAARSLK